METLFSQEFAVVSGYSSPDAAELSCGVLVHSADEVDALLFQDAAGVVVELEVSGPGGGG